MQAESGTNWIFFSAEYTSVAEACCYGLQFSRVSCLCMCVIYCQLLTSCRTRSRNRSRAAKSFCTSARPDRTDSENISKRPWGRQSWFTEEHCDSQNIWKLIMRLYLSAAWRRNVPSCCLGYGAWLHHHITWRQLCTIYLSIYFLKIKHNYFLSSNRLQMFTYFPYFKRVFPSLAKTVL